MTGCSDKIRQNIYTVMKNSGYWLQQYGQYQECLKLSPTFNYNFLQVNITNGTLNPTSHIGLCLPSQCQLTQIKDYANQIFQNMSVSATVTNINFAMQNIKSPFGFMFYLATLLIVILLGIVIYSTFVKYIQNQTKLYMFSLQQTSKYFKTNSKNNTNVFNGLKVISMLLIIGAHVFRNGGVNSINKLQQEDIFLKFYHLLIQTQGPISVFLYISGFLVSYLVLKEVMKENWHRSTNILQRMLRILPSFLFVIMLYIAYYPHLASAQLWDGNNPPKDKVQNCYNIWKIILFIDNFAGSFGNSMCYSVGWYLHVDMQLFVISIFVLKSYKKSSKTCKKIIWTLIIISMTQLFIYCQIIGYAIPILLKDMFRVGPSWGFQYSKPWKWMAPYLFGLYSGMLYYQHLQQQKNIKRQIKTSKKQAHHVVRHQLYSKIYLIFQQNKYIRILVQIFGLFLVLFYTLIPRTRQLGLQWPQIFHSLHESTVYFCIVFGVNLIILPSILGCKQSIVTFLLNTNFFNFLGKISFLTYLTHFNFMKAKQYGHTSTYYYQFTSKFIDYVSIIVIALFLSFLITIIVEAPFGVLQKLLIAKIKQKEKKTQQITNYSKPIQQSEIMTYQSTKMIENIDDEIASSSFQQKRMQINY